MCHPDAVCIASLSRPWQLLPPNGTAACPPLQELRTNDGSCLASPAAVARLPALRTLGLTTADELPALAPHLGGITRLELGSPCAAALAEDEAACQALPSLTALLCLDLKDRNYLYTKDAAAASAAREEHAHAVQALVALLPAGCEVRANAPGRP